MWRAGVERWPYKFNLFYEYFNPQPPSFLHVLGQLVRLQV